MGYCRYIGVFAVVTVLYMGRHVGVHTLHANSLLKLQTQTKCTFTETGNKTSLKTLSGGGRCTETKEEGAVLHSRALRPSATKPQIAPT